MKKITNNFIYIKKTIFLLSLSILLITGCSSHTSHNTQNNELRTNSVTIYLTRHGETLFNKMAKVQGVSDTPLTDNGKKIAAQLGKGFKAKNIYFEAAYSSDLKRAYDTAAIVLKNASQFNTLINQKETLREAAYGEFEGEFIKNVIPILNKYHGFTSPDEFDKKYGRLAANKIADTYYAIDKFQLAENSNMIEQRMLAEITHIAQKQSKKGGGNVLVVSHGMAIGIMLSKLSALYEGQALQNASVTKISYYNGQLHVESIGDTSFIE